MEPTKSKYEVGKKLLIVVGDCESYASILDKRYNHNKGTWEYIITGKGSCGNIKDKVTEEFIMEYNYAI